MLNLAGFGPDEHQLLMQAGIEGLRDILALSLDDFRDRIDRAAVELKVDPPTTSRSRAGGSRPRRSRTPDRPDARPAPRRSRHYHGRRGATTRVAPRRIAASS